MRGGLSAMLVRLCLLAAAGACASCTLNPQPEPPRDFSGSTPAGAGSTGSGSTATTTTSSTTSGGTGVSTGAGGAGPGGAGGAGGAQVVMPVADAASGPLDAASEGVARSDAGWIDGASDASIADERVVPDSGISEQGDAMSEGATSSDGPAE